MSARVLLVDDDNGVREALAFSLEEYGFTVDTAPSGEAAVTQFAAVRPDVVITDLRMPGMSGLDVVRALKADAPEVPIIVITAYGSVETAVEAMRLGASDFVGKPVARDALKMTLDRVLRHRALEEENAALRARLEATGEAGAIIASSPAMKDTLAIVDRVAATDATVLITGESGTGKELVARRLHTRSPRCDGPFVALNCSALPSELLEAELFGYERGAFTGATRPRKGRFVEASGGTLFLDEIGDLSGALQAKLLRVLQERVVDVVGGGPLEVDVRILAATHRDLRGMVAEGTFREDLFFRLHVVPIALPPLRDRPEDVGPLFRRFVERAAAQMGRPALRVDADLMNAIRLRAWPGNVRELENLATRLTVTATGDALTAADLADTDGAPRAAVGGGTGALARAADGLLQLPEEGVSLEALERAAVVAALSASRGNQSQAARFLRIPRHVLLYRMEKYGVTPADWEPRVPSPSAPIVEVTAGKAPVARGAAAKGEAS
jgi:DNA-binding NtrC family response regulator